MRDLRLANLRKTNKYLVASEKLTESLAKEGYQTRFLPPMFTENPGQIKEVGTCARLLFSGSYGRRQEC